MIRSMTGYGAAERADGDVRYSLEVRSLNNRYFKASIRLPEHLYFLEAEVDKLLRTRLNRGSVTCLLRLRDESPEAAVPINRAALERYLDQIASVSALPQTQIVVDLATLAALPGVCQQPEFDDTHRNRWWSIVEALANDAIDALLHMRKREGEAIRADLLVTCGEMREHLDAVADRAPTVVEEYRVKLQERVNKLLSTSELALKEESLIREVALFADRCDINEEIARLRSHLKQFTRLCDSPEPAGRKLEFLTQELLREANTIGSKSNDAAITGHVVSLKSNIDRLKEQVQNVE